MIGLSKVIGSLLAKSSYDVLEIDVNVFFEDCSTSFVILVLIFRQLRTGPCKSFYWQDFEC